MYVLFGNSISDYPLFKKKLTLSSQIFLKILPFLALIKISESTPVSGNNYFFSILIFCGSKSPAFNFSVCGGYVILVTENHQET